MSFYLFYSQLCFSYFPLFSYHYFLIFQLKKKLKPEMAESCLFLPDFACRCSNPNKNQGFKLWFSWLYLLKRCSKIIASYLITRKLRQMQEALIDSASFQLQETIFSKRSSSLYFCQQVIRELQAALIEMTSIFLVSLLKCVSHYLTALISSILFQ